MRNVFRYIFNFTIFIFLVALTMAIGIGVSYAQEKKGKKVQEVSFDGSDVDGETRKPDGAYLVQKKGVDFVPLYNVKSQFDQNIKESVDYIK
jgi:hypothetical protein